MERFEHHHSKQHLHSSPQQIMAKANRIFKIKATQAIPPLNNNSNNIRTMSITKRRKKASNKSDRLKKTKLNDLL
jgi:hypothetical protein